MYTYIFEKVLRLDRVSQLECREKLGEISECWDFRIFGFQNIWIPYSVASLNLNVERNR